MPSEYTQRINGRRKAPRLLTVTRAQRPKKRVRKGAVKEEIIIRLYKEKRVNAYSDIYVNTDIPRTGVASRVHAAMRPVRTDALAFALSTLVQRRRRPVHVG